MRITYTKTTHPRFKNHLFIFAFVIVTGIIFAFPSLHPFSEIAGKETSSDTIVKKHISPLDSLYKATLVKGQGLMNAGKYEQALLEYQKALKMKPEDRAVVNQIEIINKAILQQKSTEQDYLKYLSSGDNYFKTKDYLNAKSAYQQAIDLRPADQVAKDKLKQTMDLIRSLKAQNMLYDIAIAGAEKLFQAKDYIKAKAEYEKAAKMLPDEKYAKERINEIIKMMADKQEKDDLYAKAIANGDKFYTLKNYQGSLQQFQTAASVKPDEKYPKDKIAELTILIKNQKEKDEAYKKAITSADNLFQNNSYLDSKKEYQNALTIKPEESYPQTRIKQIDEILAGKLKSDQEYDRLVSTGDSLYIEKKFVGAKANYQQALKVKPGESYPKEMIAKVENAMVNQEAGQKAIDDAYQSAISAADKLLAEKSYDRSKAEYQNALNIKPAEKYPTDKINEIAGILAQADKQKNLDDRYNALIAGADKLFTDKAYELSRTEFDKANKLKPDERYPKDKIAEIAGIIANESQQKAKADHYAKTIEQADKFFLLKSYEQSKTQYQLALQIKPDESYPKEKIAQLDNLLGDIAVQKANDEQYRNIVLNADKLLNAKSYSEAKSEYSKALNIKPGEEYPQKRIEEIDRYFAGLAELKAKEEKYKTTIEKADQLLTDKSYEPAKTEYSNAQLIKPDESYPKTRINEIDQILNGLAKQKSLEDRYNSLRSESTRLNSSH